MFDKIYDKIYKKDNLKAFEDIIQYYQDNGYCIVNFLYFYNLIHGGIFTESKDQTQQNYKKSLLNSDFLLPDGIAMQLLIKRWYKQEIQNLNGTDFLPFFLDKLEKDDLGVYFYGAFQKNIQKAKQYFEQKFGQKVNHFQNGYEHFDWDQIDDDSGMKILLVGKGSPIQENRVFENIEIIRQKKLLVFCVGGLFDFWAGAEKRAPKLIRSLKLEWFWRVLQNPAKNFKKSFFTMYYLVYFLLSSKFKTSGEKGR
ncbi:WecB/TagA/CpsF family glycosyltransferase [Candidatus Absconditicoccus praedator]|uniref:WecB/TagA/CpsF family glycosyltransferase n=1 Tax=Candidatus Absconditicoccus praedator TaxID=2735562 RepID=UPI001E4984AE|nr:WecB/TagA/CpsF family glycosyltransferase [Candidatus Absconditicoccus praedator]UFX82676.1 WecB/TagA/CpsF family glycosyltransferase [Candidatus Absconditicoccus praedator]